MAYSQARLTEELGSGWTLEAGTLVTSDNQDQFQQEIGLSACVPTKAEAVTTTTTGVTEYLPPVGWTVYTATKSDGTTAALWYDPSYDVAYDIMSCLGGTMGSGGASGSSSSSAALTKAAGFPWLLVGGAALLLYWIYTKDKKPAARKPMRKPSRRKGKRK